MAEALPFWQFYAPAPEAGEGAPPQAQSDWFVNMVEAWNAEHEQQIALSYVPASEYIGGTQLQTAFASAEGPDIFLISPGDFLRYYNGGVLLELDPYIEDDAREDFPEGVLESRVVDGSLYGIPMEVEPMAMFYSVQAFEEAGLSEADVPETWDDLLDVADKLTTADRFGVLFETAPGYYQNFTWYPFMWQGGGEAVDPEANEAVFASDASVEALRLWQTTIEEGLAPREVQGVGGNDISANLASGFCAIQNIGIWAVASLEQDHPDFEYGVFRVPTPAGGEYTTVLGGWAFAVNADGRNPEGAAEFVSWAIASMSEDSIQRGVEWAIEAKSVMPPRDSVLEAASDQGGFDSEAMQTFEQEVLPDSRAEPRYPPEVYRAISDAIQACQLDGVDPEEAVEQAQGELDGFLLGYQGAL